MHTFWAVLFLLVIGFFAITRTQVGRDGLGRQIEAQFSSAYSGSLKIGKLTGNVLANLYASDIVIADSGGRELVRIDSVVIRPKWGPLFRRSFSVHDITLYHPEILVAFDSLGGSSLEKAMIPNSIAESDTSRAWTFESASVFVRDAVLRLEDPWNRFSTTGTEATPFDIRNTVIDRLNLGAQIDWTGAEKQIDLLRLSANLSDAGITLTTGVSQVLVNNGRIIVNHAEFETDGSSISLSGFSDHVKDADLWSDAGFQLDISNSSLDFEEVRSFLPDLPLYGTANMNAHVEGPLSDMTVSWVNLEAGASSMELSGTVAGFPDSLLIDLSVTNTSVLPNDLRNLLPDAGWTDDLRVDTIDVQVYTRGVISGLRKDELEISARSSFDIDSEGGSVSGSFSVSGTQRDSLYHQASLLLENVDLYQWTNRAKLRSDISGVAQSEGSLLGGDSLYSNLVVNLGASSLTTHVVEALELDVSISPDSISGSLMLNEGSGTVVSNGALLLGSRKLLSAKTRLSNANVGPLLGFSSLSSAINAEIEMVASLNWDETFEAELSAEVAQSRLTIGDSTAFVPAHSMHGVVSQPVAGSPQVVEASEAAPILDFTSDMFDLQLNSSADLKSFIAVAQSWVASIRSSVDTELNKTLYEDLAREERSATLALNEMLAADKASQTFSTADGEVSSAIELAIHDASLFSSLSPTFPDFDGNAVISADLSWSPQVLETTVRISTANFSVPGAEMSGFSGEMSVGFDRTRGLVESAEVSSSLNADTLHTGGLSFINQVVTLEMMDGAGSFLVSNSGSESVDSLLVGAQLFSGEGSNAIIFDQFLLSAGTGDWILESPATLSLFGDASSLDELNLRFVDDGLRTNQSLHASGTLSAAASDSVVFKMNNLLLRPLSEFLSMRRLIGGQLNSEFVVSGGRRSPRVVGSASVVSLSLDEKLLGDVELSSNYIAGFPDVAVDLNITPADSAGIPRLFGTVIPAEWVENELSVQGNIRLPSSDSEDLGALNLDMNVDRLDLFFFKYIFQEALGTVSGFATGSGTITGELFHPIFDLNFGILDGYFDIPLTQAQYALDGTIRIDAEAIHFDPANLTDQTNGTAQLTGRLLFNDYTAFTLDIAGSLNDLLIMNVDHSDRLPFYGFLWASGDLLLTGPLFDSSLTSSNARTRSDSELFIPIEEETSESDEAFMHYADSIGFIPDFDKLAERPFLLSRRPTAERQFLDGLNLDLNIFAPPGSTVHLVIDPLLGDVINAVSTGNVQLLLANGEFQVFGQLEVTSGDYQFTAGELFIRTFLINEGGSIVWEGDPVNAQLNIPASYRTRASRTGLPGLEGERGGLIPLIVNLQIDGTVDSPAIGLSLAVDRTNQNVLGDYQAFEAQLNQPDRATEYATSVLILNSFQLTTDNITTDSGGQLAFNSVSQLVSAQLNRFLSAALPNVDFSFGLQGESAQDLDVTYGVAMRFLNDRLVIRGEGVYQGNRASDNVRTNEGLQGEFVVELKVGPKVSVEVFFRREGDILETSELTNTAGVGLSYRTEFDSWRSVVKKALGKPDGSP